ncbi:MAG TPA: YciI family protein [Candidatus Nitrosotalea sp.]|nr:YciI family protein [Candidatus Nitrosotalea sp.]
MAKKITNEYLLLFRGGANPEDMSPEQMQTTMQNWMTWMKGLKKSKQLTLGHPLQDGGKALSGAKGRNVEAFRDTPDSIGGYLLIKAKNLSEATKIAKGCPIFNNGGTVELRSIQQIPGM